MPTISGRLQSMAEQGGATEPKSKEALLDPIKKLIEQGKETGFLTYEEINRRLPEGVIGGEELDDLFGTLEDMGIEVVDREEDLLRPSEKPPEEEVPLPDLGVETTNSIRMYLTEMGKVPLLTREQELTLTRNIKENEKTLKLIVLENPITLRELRNWESLLAQQEMTPKELMPRGRKTNQELARSEEHTSELQSQFHLVCRLLLEKKKMKRRA